MSLTKSELDAVMQEFNSAIDQIQEQAMNEVVARAKMLTPVRTGVLQASISGERKPYGFDVYSNVEYAAYIEYGTPTISPYLMITTAANDIDNILLEKAKDFGL